MTYYYEGLENDSSSGGSCQAFVGDVYTFSAGHWVLYYLGLQGASPSPRILATVVDDAADHIDLLYGGQRGNYGPFYSSTWAFDPSRHGVRGQPLEASVASLAPTVTTHTYYLAPGNYSLETGLSGYDPVTTALNVTGPMTVGISLTANRSIGIYTPLWAWSNAQLAMISTSGAGTPTSPYVLENSPVGELAALFGVRNDFLFPAYPGIFLLDTTASVDVTNPPIFAPYISAPPGLHASASLPFWFWNVSGVALTGGVHLGNFQIASSLGPFAVAFYDSTHNLIAGNSFTARLGSLLLQFGPDAGPFAGPGGENTVWGNSFGLVPNQGELGLAEVEPNDLIYNNEFLTLATACSPGDPTAANYCWPVYSFAPVAFSDRWNITPQPASDVHYADGFPDFPLTGSIVRSERQGGNEWLDYGDPLNPLGALPYDERVDVRINSSTIVEVPLITPGGDSAPLLSRVVVTFYETGLPFKTVSRHGWSVVLDGVVEHSTASDIVFFNVTPGPHHQVLVTGPNGFRTTVSGALSVTQDPINDVTVPFARGPTHTLTLLEKGLAVGKRWCVSVDGSPECSTQHALRFGGLSPGVYNVSVTQPPTGGLRVLATAHRAPVNLSRLGFNSSEKVTIAFAYEVTFEESGLPNGTAWSVRIGGTTESALTATIGFDLTNGTYRLTVGPVAGYHVVGGAHAKVVVDGASVRVSVTFASGS